VFGKLDRFELGVLSIGPRLESDGFDIAERSPPNVAPVGPVGAEPNEPFGPANAGANGLGVDGLGVDGLGVDGLGVDGLGRLGDVGDPPNNAGAPVGPGVGMAPGTDPEFNPDVDDGFGSVVSPPVEPPSAGFVEPMLASGFASKLMGRGGLSPDGGSPDDGSVAGFPPAKLPLEVVAGLTGSGEIGLGEIGVFDAIDVADDSRVRGLVGPSGPLSFATAGLVEGETGSLEGAVSGSGAGKVDGRLLLKLGARLLLLRFPGRVGIFGPIGKPAGRGGGSLSLPFDAGPRSPGVRLVNDVAELSTSAGLRWLAIRF
jgi:hypothetical protein